MKLLLRHKENSHHGPHLRGAQSPLQGHVPVTQDTHVRMHEAHVSSPSGSHGVTLGPEPVRLPAAGPHPDPGSTMQAMWQVPKPAD